MVYALHIERLPLKGGAERAPISLKKWKKALSGVEGVRLCVNEAYNIRIPDTGKVLSIPHRGGDAEVYFPDEKKWHAVFNWFNGSATFKADIALGHLPNPVWTAAGALASRLEAVIRGDAGERYDLRTGEVVGA
jgi:hypothetical protein